MNVVVIDDDPELCTLLATALGREGHTVRTAGSLATGREQLEEIGIDVVVLDLGLPDGDGLQLCRELRATGRPIGILVLSAAGAVTARVDGLDAGADDYLVKPFGAAELLARVRAQLRRQALASSSAQAALHFGRTSVDLARRVVERDGEPLHLTPIEYRLLTHLAAQPDRVVTHQQLLKAVWGPGHAEDTHYVRVHMANLRKKVEDDASMPRHLLTEAGIGYRFRP